MLFMKRNFLSVFSLFLLLPVCAVQGEEVLDSTATRLDEVVVSATRWQQNPKLLPQRVITISSETVGFRQPQTAADLLGLSGQVFIQKSQQGGGSPMIRGFATHRLLYAVDGVRMNTAIFRAGNLQNVISLDPFTLQSTEVRLGPGSVIYGSDAIGGVMSFQTLTPTLSAEGLRVRGKAGVRYSSANNERTAHFDINLGGRKWAWVASVSHFQFDDLRQGSHGPSEYLKPWLVETASDGTDKAVPNPNPQVQSPSGYGQWNVMQKLRYQPSAAWDFQYAFHHSQTTDYGRYDRHTRLRKGKPRYAEWSYGPQIWQMHQLTAAYRADNRFFDRMTLRAAMQHFEESRIDRAFGKPLRTTQTEKVNAYSLNIDFAKELSAHSLYYGVEAVRNDVKSNGKTTDIHTLAEAPASSRYPQAKWTSLAAYTQALLRLHRKVNMEIGLRYNHFSTRADFTNIGIQLPFAPDVSSNHGALSGGIGLVYTPSEQSRFTFHYSRAFRSPNIDDMGKLFDAVDKAVVVPNPDLHAEYAHHFEIGAEQRVGQWLRLGMTAFYTYLDHALVRRPYRWNGQDSIVYKGEQSQVLALQNAAWARVWGLQVQADATLPFGFGFRTFLNWQKGKEQLDDGSTSALRHAAPFFGTAALSYCHKALHVEAYADFQGHRKYEDLAEEERGKTEIYALDEQGHPYVPAWLTLNVKGSYNFGHGLMLHLGLENITNLRYRPYSSGISAAGRNFMAAVSYRF